MAAPQPRRDWYTLSVDTLRGWGIFVVVLLAGVGGFFGYRQWERFAVERDAGAVIDEVRVLLERLSTETGLEAFRNEYQNAQQSWQEARASLPRSSGSRRSPRAGAAARCCCRSATRCAAAAPPARRSSSPAQGGVEFRRGDGGDWEEARSRVVAPLRRLREDHRATARPRSCSSTARSTPCGRTPCSWSPRRAATEPGRAASRRSRWSTAGSTSTPRRATSQRHDAERRGAGAAGVSEAFVAVRPGRRPAAASRRLRRRARGRLRGGLEREVKRARAGGADRRPARPSRRRCRPAPQLLEPADNLEARPRPRSASWSLAWQPVPGAGALRPPGLAQPPVRRQLDRRRQPRRRPRATLGLRGEGTFHWRVAAFGKDGLQGPWSTPRQFRVASLPRRRRRGRQDAAGSSSSKTCKSYG